MFIYEEYLKKEDALSVDQAVKIYQAIGESLDPNDEDSMEIWGEYLAAAVKYSGIRAGRHATTR